MNRFISLFMVAGPTRAATAQQLEGIELLSPPCSPVQAQVTVFFPFGFEQICPILTGQNMISAGDIASIDLYYDVSGPWPMVSCWNTTLVEAELPPGITYLSFRTFSIMDGDTSAVVSDTLLAYCPSAGIADWTMAGPGTWIQDNELYWHRMEGSRMEPVRIIASNGQCKAICDHSQGSCWLGDLPPGVYVAILHDRTMLRFVRP